MSTLHLFALALLSTLISCGTDSTSGNNLVDNATLQLVSITPKTGADSVDLNITMDMLFNHLLLTSAVNDSTFQIRDPAGKTVPMLLTKSATGERVTASPKQALLTSTTYTLTLKGGRIGLISDSGQTLLKDVVTTFTTRAAIQSTGLALMRWADIASKFAGTFHLPVSTGGVVGVADNFIYSAGIHTQLANGNLIVEGHPYIHRQVEVELPAALNGGAAKTVGTWLDYTNDLHPPNWVPGGEAYNLGGLLDLGNRVYFTKFQWYNGSGTDWASVGYREAGVSKGMWNVSGTWAHNQRIGGYMSYAPKILSDSGYTLLAGQQGTSGAALGRWGPNLFALKGDFPVSITSPVQSKPLISHPTDANLFPGWWIGDRVSSIVWIETKTQQALLVFLYQQLGGNNWYGEATHDTALGQIDPYGGYKGFHASGYVLQVWIYDPDVLLEVFKGKRNPWSVLPAEKIALTERVPGDTADKRHSFITGKALQNLQASYRNGRLVILQPDGYREGLYEIDPKGYVLQLE